MIVHSPHITLNEAVIGACVCVALRAEIAASALRARLDLDEVVAVGIEFARPEPLWPQFGAEAQQAQIDGSVIEELGFQLFNAEGYVIPTIVASILLLAALLGAIRVAFPIKREKED